MIKFGKMICENIGPFKKLVYNFDNDLSTNVIVGINRTPGFQENGVGKSFIPDALLWIMYGIVRTTEKGSIINVNEDNCNGELEIWNDDEKYLIKRSIKKSITKLKLIKCNNKNKELGRKILDVQAIINDLFGTYNATSSVVYLTQENIMKFLFGTSSERINILVSFFPILLVWDKAVNLCKLKIKEQLGKIDSKNYKLKYLLDSIQEIDYDKVQYEKTETHKIVNQLKKEIVIANERFDEIKYQLELIEKLNRNIDILKNKKLNVNTTITALKNNIILFGDEKIIRKSITKLKADWRKNWRRAGKSRTYENMIDDLEQEEVKHHNKKITADKGSYSCNEKITELTKSIQYLLKNGECPFCLQLANEKCNIKIKQQIKIYNNRKKAFDTISENLQQKLNDYHIRINKLLAKINKCKVAKQLVEVDDEKIEEQYEKLEKVLKIKSDIEQQQQNYILFRKKILKVINELKKEIGSEKLDKDDINKITTDVGNLKVELTKNKLKIKSLKDILRKYRSIKRTLEITNVKIDKLQNKINIYEYLKIIFFKSKINVINHINLVLEKNFNYYLDVLQFESFAEFVTKIGSGKKDKYEILLADKHKILRDIRTYSYGERKRFNIACITAIQATLDELTSMKYDTLIIDEILTNLDEVGKTMVMSLINQINKNKHIIVLDNDLEYINTDYKLVKVIMNRNGRSSVKNNNN